MRSKSPGNRLQGSDLQSLGILKVALCDDGTQEPLGIDACGVKCVQHACRAQVCVCVCVYCLCGLVHRPP